MKNAIKREQLSLFELPSVSILREANRKQFSLIIYIESFTITINTKTSKV